MLRCLERPLNLPAYQHSFHLSSIPSSFLPLSHAHFLFRWQLFFTEVKTKAEEGAVICNVSVRGRGTTKTRKERDWYEYVKILGKKRHSAPHKTKHTVWVFNKTNRENASLILFMGNWSHVPLSTQTDPVVSVTHLFGVKPLFSARHAYAPRPY